MKKLIPVLLTGLLFLNVSASAVPAKDKITQVKLHTHPSEANIRPGETAILHAEFFGTKKKGFLENLFGDKEAELSPLESNTWKIEILTANGGLLSKPFRYQEEGEKTKGGLAGFLTQSLGAVSSKNSILYTAPGKPGKYKVKLTEGSLAAEIEITVAGTSFRYGEETSFQKVEPGGSYLLLAARYAPFVAQETWFDPKADYIARFDFDGNWKGDDNWENLEKGSSQAFVYYAAMETATHWFLHYNFFHPRDYSDACVAGTCHENDIEGMILTIRKDGTEHGKLEMMETLAHNNVYTFTNESRIKKKVHDIDGRLDVFEDTHPIVFIEAGGHGVLSATHKTSLYDSSKMKFKQSTGVTYIHKPGKPAERPAHPDDDNVGYSLIPIESTWWQKGSGNTDTSNETFEQFFVYEPFGNRPGASRPFIAGAFKGRTASDNMAKPFWGWHDRKTRKKRILNTGQWALDPAYAISVCFRWPDELPVSTDYTYNPFLAGTP